MKAFGAYVLPVTALLLAAFPPLALAQTAEAVSQRAIRLSATGVVKARPNTAQIKTGVVTEGETAQEALEANNAAMAKVVATLQENGLQERDIQTVDFSVHPRYQHPKDGAEPVIVGYRVVNSVRITASDLAKLGEILDTVVSLGSNQIDGISFSVSEPAALMDKARKLAMADAKRKAELYAEAAGARVGRVLSIDEQSFQQPRPPFFTASRAEAKASDVPIQPGEQEVQIEVTVVWELEDAKPR